MILIDICSSQGIRKFGKNFSAIAAILGTKTESHVRSFFVNYRRRYDLDLAYKEYEAEFGPSEEAEAREEEVGEAREAKEAKEAASPKPATPASPRARSPATKATSNGASGK